MDPIQQACHLDPTKSVALLTMCTGTLLERKKAQKSDLLPDNLKIDLNEQSLQQKRRLANKLNITFRAARVIPDTFVEEMRNGPFPFLGRKISDVAPFYKINLLRMALSRHCMAVWMDCDTTFGEKAEIRLRDLLSKLASTNKSLSISHEMETVEYWRHNMRPIKPLPYFLNTGFFILRRSSWAGSLLHKAKLDRYKNFGFLGSGLHDQGTLNLALFSDENWHKQVSVEQMRLSRKSMNATIHCGGCAATRDCLVIHVMRKWGYDSKRCSKMRAWNLSFVDIDIMRRDCCTYSG